MASDTTLRNEVGRAIGIYNSGASPYSLLTSAQVLKAQLLADSGSTSAGRLGREYAIEAVAALITEENVRIHTLNALMNGSNNTSAMLSDLEQRNNSHALARTLLLHAMSALGMR